MNDEFYVGYESEMPPGMAKRVQALVLVLVIAALLLPGMLILGHDRFAPAIFEFGQPRPVSGRLIEHPYPGVSTTDASGALRIYWLVAPGKHGAADLVAGLDGAMARVNGTLIERDGDVMLQVEPGGIEVTSRPTGRGLGERVDVAVESDALKPRASVVWTGEIVDGKCHLGVMKPGEGPTHRDCAVRCLLGGVPPMFVPRRASGAGSTTQRASVPDLAAEGAATEASSTDSSATPQRLAIVTRDGRALPSDALMPVVGKPVQVRGTVLERAGQRFLALSPEDIAPAFP
jgi:hypothetical protein